MTTKQEIKDLSLEETLISHQKIAANIIKDIKNNEDLKNMGIECLSIYLTSISPTTELAKALEAEYREKLQKKADEAIYSRRAAAVEQEKKIKENELNSQIYIETKNKELLELKGQNILKEAEFKAKAKELEFKIYNSMDSKILLALGLKALGENANKIANINITPEILATILNLKEQK